MTRVDDDLAVMPVAQFLDRRGGALRPPSSSLGIRAARFFNASRNIARARFRPGSRRARAPAPPCPRCDQCSRGAVTALDAGQRDFEMNDFGGERALAGEGAFVTGDAVGGRTLAVLDRICT